MRVNCCEVKRVYLMPVFYFIYSNFFTFSFISINFPFSIRSNAQLKKGIRHEHDTSIQLIGCFWTFKQFRIVSGKGQTDETLNVIFGIGKTTLLHCLTQSNLYTTNYLVFHSEWLSDLRGTCLPFLFKNHPFHERRIKEIERC